MPLRASGCVESNSQGRKCRLEWLPFQAAGGTVPPPPFPPMCAQGRCLSAS